MRILFLSLWLLCATAFAQPLTLQEAQQLAVARSEQLVANDAAAAASRDMAVAAGQLPDPVLKVGVENVPVSGPDRLSLNRDFMTMTRVGVMQELTRGDKRRLRAERAGLEGARVKAERLQILAEIQRETAMAWISVRYTTDAVQLLSVQLAEAKLQVDAAQAAFRADRGSQADVFAARTAVVGLEDRQRQAQQQARSARLALARWIGSDAAQRPLAGAVAWRESASVQNVLEGRHLQQHPHLLVQEARLAAAETEVKQAEANTVPDWTVELMYSRRGPAFPDMVSIGASVPLQLDRPKRQNRELAAKVSMLAEAEASLEELRRAEDARVRGLLEEWSSGRQRVDALASDLLPAAKNRTEAALAAYRAGKGELAAVLMARQGEIDARLQVLMLEQETAKVWAQLRHLVADPALGGDKE